ncbi:hypothetical protein [Streptomyces bottropensis]|uniref:hypothetical protein n=1 Tax=Streptomyces bottropensis TaxID=42235 RepID=UPI00369F1CD9
MNLPAAGGGSVTDRLRDMLVEHPRLILVENIEANTAFYNSRGMPSPQRERDVRRRERQYTLLVRDVCAEGVTRGSSATSTRSWRRPRCWAPRSGPTGASPLRGVRGKP